MLVDRYRYYDHIFWVRLKNLFPNILCVKNIYIVPGEKCPVPLKSARDGDYLNTQNDMYIYY